MNTIRILHTADWHADNDSKKQKKLKASLDQILEYVQNNKVNALIHAGDMWEKEQRYSQNSAVPIIMRYLKAIARHVDYIFIVKGNNSHDAPGSISLLHQLEPNILAYEHPVVLAIDSDGDEFAVTNLLRINEPIEFNALQYIISLVPYPTKALFVKEQSIDLNNAKFVSMFEGVFELIADRTEPYTCPKILAFHGNVVGSRLSTGQTLLSQDIMVAPTTLRKAKADYYALGHIHLRQEIQPNMVYSGSVYNKNWGETEQKSFEVIEFVDTTPFETEANIEPYNYPVALKAARPMITIEADFMPDLQGYFDLKTQLEEPIANAEYRFRCKVRENDRKLITNEVIEWVKEQFGEDVKIEWDVIPDERESRSEAIMQAKTLLDEVKEYAKVINSEITVGIKEKVNLIEGENNVS